MLNCSTCAWQDEEEVKKKERKKGRNISSHQHIDLCFPSYPLSLPGNTDPNPITSAYMSTPTLSQLNSAANYQSQQTSNSAAVAAAHAHAAAAASNASNMAMTPAAAAAAAGKQMEGKSALPRLLLLFLSLCRLRVFYYSFSHPHTQSPLFYLW